LTPLLCSCEISAVHGVAIAVPTGGDSFNGNYDFPGRRYSLSVVYDFGGNLGLPPRR
jgi:hypothetical protein